MELIPFEKIIDVPTGKGGGSGNVADILCEYDFIDIADIFQLEVVRAARRSNYRGVSGYMFDARLYFGFNKNYEVEAVEFRLPLGMVGEKGLFFNGVNLFQPTLNDVLLTLDKVGVSVQKIDVGLEAPTIGVSFFSNDFENDLAVKLDAVTVNLHKSHSGVSSR